MIGLGTIINGGGSLLIKPAVLLAIGAAYLPWNF